MPSGYSDNIDGYFERAAAYRAFRSGRSSTLKEPGGHYSVIFSERHLQCIWYDPVLRPRRLLTSEGEPVTVENPGVWNLEAGPDFLGAVIHVNNQRHIAGDVEIHISPTDWKQHGHHTDPRYEHVRVHVTYRDAAIPEELFPKGTIHIALQPILAQHPEFSFDTIDTTAYPYGSPGNPPPCRPLFQQQSPRRIKTFLESAGEERLRRKTLRIQNDLAHTPSDQVLYQELMTALGYKNNKIPFRKLAQIVSLKKLRHIADGNAQKAYALLLGCAGLIPEDISSRLPAESRTFIRTLWDIWWKEREHIETPVLEKHNWNLAGLRPANHPVRRLMAAAHLFANVDTPFEELGQNLPTDDAKHFIHQLQRLLSIPDNTWWNTRLSWKSQIQKPSALLGSSRTGTIITNILIPYLAATGFNPDLLKQVIRQHLPPEPLNAVIKQTAYTLFGRDCPATQYNTTLARQGLIQIFNDFCLNDRSRCRQCPLPDSLPVTTHE